MVDLDTHSIVDMIESREQAKVVEWLKSYPNIQIVSRDGSLTYHNSITKAHPKALQVSDRFHLFKNLTDYALEYLKKHLSKVIKIVVDCADKPKSSPQTISKANENRKLTLKEKYHKILLMQAEKRSQTEICREINMDVRCYKKLMSASDIERQKMFKTVASARHEDKILSKMKVVSEVRALKQKGLSKRAISRETGLTTTTISIYLDENFNPVHASYGVKRPGKLSPYYSEIDTLLDQGLMASKIEQIIRQKGYEGSSSTVRSYVAKWKKRFKNETTKINSDNEEKIITIKRNVIFSTLFKPISNIKGLDEDIFKLFCKQYPLFKSVHELVNSFKQIFKHKDPKLLGEWVIKASNTGIKEIISFVNGLKRDYDAVEKSVYLPYSNGLAEGCVNKIKVIKRVMYGRCSFETLRIKAIFLNRIRRFQPT